MRGEDPVPLAVQFQFFGESAGRDGSAIYRRICEGVAGDPELLDLAALSPPEQRRPNLLLAAVHFLLLGGDPHPLGELYPTVSAFRSPGRPASGGDPFPPFRDFCLCRRHELAALLTTRATQTNEVGRSAALLPGLVAAEGAAGRPLALIDLGASAGLNLLFDRFGYDYGAGRRLGDPDSPVQLSCEVRHGHPALRMPHVAHRAGLDRHPVDPTDEPSARWLLACLWPDQLARFVRLRAALELAAADPERPPVDRGDVVDDLPAAAGRVPGSAALCVFHSWVAAYLTLERQQALARAVGRLAAARPVVWLYAEAPYEVPGLIVPPAPPEGRRGATALVLTTFDHGTPESRRLADMHPHGRWLRWWDG